MADSTMNPREFDERVSQAEPDAVTRCLGELRQVDPPPEMVGEVMARVGRGHQRSLGDRWPTGFAQGRTMAKRALWGIAAIAAVLFVAMKITGFPPTPNGT